MNTLGVTLLVDNSCGCRITALCRVADAETRAQLPPPVPKKDAIMRRKKLTPGLVYPRKKRRGKRYLFYEEMGRVIVNTDCVDRIK